MAYVDTLRDKAGEPTSYRVRWRMGGARTGKGESERFDDPDSAKAFCDVVNEHGQQWPPGWVKGKGYIVDTSFRFAEYAHTYVENLTGIEDQYRRDCLRDLDRWIIPTFGNCDVRSVEHFCSDSVQAWVRQLEQTMVTRGQLPKKGQPKLRKMSPKTIRNLHGLLSAILMKAVKAEPPLRLRNPCELTRLPRTDDDGAPDGGDDIYFLTPDEVAAVIGQMERRSDQVLATIKYGTGLRWSEVSALSPDALESWDTSRPVLRVKRSWKRDGHGGYKLGEPKSKRSRRTVRLSEAVVHVVNELGGPDEERPDRLFFTNEEGKRLHYSSFYDRWQRAVKRAHAAGTLPKQKRPTPHDLRHSHAAVLLSEGRGLTYVQRRLGHESIQTTSDTYGHLLPEADDEAMDAIDRSIQRGGNPGGPVQRESAVHTVQLPDGERVAFWNSGHADLLVAVWKMEHGQTLRVEPWPVIQWQRQMPGGIDAVRSEFPERARVWMLGPAVYGPDGEEQASEAGVHELRERWAWEWDQTFTAASAHGHAEYRPAPSQQTEAAAWGVDPDQVRRAYVVARSTALRMCGGHPALAGNEGGDRRERSGAVVTHTDS